MDLKEKRIRAITRLYYSNPAVVKAIVDFSKDREVVPRYFEGFGKRPDAIQYPSDVHSLVKKGATSFHCSEELWSDPLQLNSDMTLKEIGELRRGWDLLIDIDSKYLDVSKILTSLILETLENQGIRNYGVKFSGSKGFHIIVSGQAFPNYFNGTEKSQAFPEWPRAICEFLTHVTRREFNKKVGLAFGDLKKIEERVGDNDKMKESLCPNCGRAAKKGNLITLRCPECKTTIQRKDMKVTKKRLKCIQEGCGGVFEIKEEGNYFQCDYCEEVSSIDRRATSGRYTTTFTVAAKKSEDYTEEMKEEYSGTFFGASDLVLVASRHLFRMPYSLHEKTSLASVVLKKNEINNFAPKDADPMKVKIRDFMPSNFPEDATHLLKEALEWKKKNQTVEEAREEKKYSEKIYKDMDYGFVEDYMFPPAIKKLLKGLSDGRKRGLFVLLTFLKSLNFPPEDIYKRVKGWNEKNDPPLKEGYVRSQVEWHLKQKKKILPPNYSNDAFYRDLGLIKEKPKTRNPLVDVGRQIRKRN